MADVQMRFPWELIILKRRALHKSIAILNDSIFFVQSFLFFLPPPQMPSKILYKPWVCV